MSHLKVSTITFNCGRERVKPSIFARHLLSAIPKSKPPELLILCLQEIAPLSYSFLGGSFLHPYYHSLRHAVRLAAAALDDATYVNVMVRNVGMTAIMAFVLQEHVERIKRFQTAGVGVGMYEMGNKGAVGLRFAYSVGTLSAANGDFESENEDGDEPVEEEKPMEITVVAVHLAPMEYAVDRRNEDWKSIVMRLVFTSDVQNNHISPREQSKTQMDDDGDENAALLLSPNTPTFTSTSSAGAATAAPIASGLFRPTSHLIFAGDLNYRTSDFRPTPRDYESYPQPVPEDSYHPKHYSNLLKKDQLWREMRAGRTCHGLQEAPIDFPPTYKYSDRERALADKFDNESNVDPNETEARWDWTLHRWPSWCDRILYLDLPPWMKIPSPPSFSPSTSIQIHEYTSLPLMATSDHQPVILSLSIPLKAIPPPPPPPPTNNIATNPSATSRNELNSEDVRIHPPFEIDPDWRVKRARARRRELVVGLMMYLATTGEGNLVLFATVVVAVGGWWIGWRLLKG